MMDYTGLKCPVCNQEFQPDDDIVVCPECGAPYHRACYKKNGACVYADKHGMDEAWQPPKKEPDPNQSAAETSRCPRCGKENPKGTLFCENCGCPLMPGVTPGAVPPGRGAPPHAAGQQTTPPQYNPSQPGGIPPIPIIFDPLGGVNPNDEIDGVQAGEIAKLVQANTQYYLPVFSNYKRFKKRRFNFSAFLFSGGWMLYRKQYKKGILFTAIMLALYLISNIVMVNFSYPIAEQMMQAAGISSSTVYFASDQILQLYDAFVQLPFGQALLFSLPSIIMLVQFVLMIIVGLNANKWYLKHCVEKVKEIHAGNPDDSQTSMLLQNQGGVNTSLAICLFICYMILVYLPRIL